MDDKNMCLNTTILNNNLIDFLFVCLAGPGKYFDPSFGMGYLMSPYTAAYANGFGGPHMVRQIFFLHFVHIKKNIL